MTHIVKHIVLTINLFKKIKKYTKRLIQVTVVQTSTLLSVFCTVTIVQFQKLLYEYVQYKYVQFINVFRNFEFSVYPMAIRQPPLDVARCSQ